MTRPEVNGVEDLEHLLVNIVAERTREMPWLFDDALQEARIGAWQRLEEGKGPGIAVYKARQAATDVVRGRRMTGSKEGSRIQHGAHDVADSIFRHTEDGGFESGSGGKDWEVQIPGVSEVMRQIVEIEERAMLRTALKVLGAREQRIVWLRFYEGLTLQEVGSREGISHQRVTQILNAAYPKMRAALAEEES